MDILRTLADERALRLVYLRYCDIIDAKDFDRLDEVFTPDCVGDYRSTNGLVQEGLAPLVRHLHTVMGAGSNCGPTHHNVMNFRFDIDGDRATGVVHFYAVHRGRGPAAGGLYMVWGRYEDALVRTGDGWRVSGRRYTNDVTDGDRNVIGRGIPATATPPDG